MSYVYRNAEDLQGHALVDNYQCVRLVQVMAHVPNTHLWRAGATVRGNTALAKGTVIATFANGIYPSHRHGNHAAFYLGQDATGIWVMDQWKAHSEADQRRLKPTVSKRHIRFKGHVTANMSDNADAYSVVEIRGT